MIPAEPFSEPLALRMGFHTRLPEDASAGERFPLTIAQIVHAEACGFDSAWVGQHHFQADEGGLPAPLVFLAQLAGRTRHIRLGTGTITLPVEHPLRMAEDAAVVDLLSQGRLEVVFGMAATPSDSPAFLLTHEQRADIFEGHLALVRSAWNGEALPGGERLYPAVPRLAERIWRAASSVAAAARAGRVAEGLILPHGRPRLAGARQATLAERQQPIVDAYLDALPCGAAPRILALRSVFVADDSHQARRIAEAGLRRFAWQLGGPLADAPLDTLLSTFEVHVGSPPEVRASLNKDPMLACLTDLCFQVHPIDPPQEDVLRSTQLIAKQVVPGLCRMREPAPDEPETSSS